MVQVQHELLLQVLHQVLQVVHPEHVVLQDNLTQNLQQEVHGLHKTFLNKRPLGLELALNRNGSMCSHHVFTHHYWTNAMHDAMCSHTSFTRQMQSNDKCNATMQCVPTDKCKATTNAMQRCNVFTHIIHWTMLSNDISSIEQSTAIQYARLSNMQFNFTMQLQD